MDNYGTKIKTAYLICLENIKQCQLDNAQHNFYETSYVHLNIEISKGSALELCQY